MSIYQSTGLRDFLQQGGCMRRAFLNGELRIRSGSAPADANAAETGTLLVTVTVASGTRTNEVRAAGSVRLDTGGSGSVNTVTVSGIEVMGSATNFDTSLIVTAANVVDKINKWNPMGIWAVTDGAATPTITLYAPLGAGAVTWTVASTVTTITKTDSNFSGGTAPANGLQYGLSSTGAVAKTGVWSGVVGAGGVAGYWRLCGSVSDAGGSSTTLIRLQGTCGTSGADYNMGSTTLVLSATHTVDTWTLTEPAS